MIMSVFLVRLSAPIREETLSTLDLFPGAKEFSPERQGITFKKEVAGSRARPFRLKNADARSGANIKVG